MKQKHQNIICSVLIFIFLFSSSYVSVVSNTMLANNEEDVQLNNSRAYSCPPNYIISKLSDGQQEIDISEFESNNVEETEINEVAINSLEPIFGDLTITLIDSVYSLEPNLAVKQQLTIPPDDKILRGELVRVQGQLWGGIPGRFWDGETVYLYYNITKEQYEGNQAFYFGNGQYEVGSAVTNSTGEFSIDLATSDLSSSPFSKVGQINLLTWFNGSSAERLAGSPGAKNVTFFGQMEFQTIASVTNPDNPYSFTTSILFDNGTTVQTSGTEYHLKIDWLSDAFDHEANHTFTASNQHTYSATSPASVETVYYTALFDITQLGIDFFVENGSDIMVSEDYTIDTYNEPYETEETVIVDAYFDITGTYLKGPQEIQMGSTVDFFANLSDSDGIILSPSFDIDIYILYGTSKISIGSNTTISGEITYNIYFDPSVYIDVTQGISVLFEFYDSYFGEARFENTSLSTILAVDIGNIELTLDDSDIYYTTSMSLGFTVLLEDVNGNPAQSSRFQLNFPGIGTEEIVTATGTQYVTKTVPSYVVQNDFETIIVTAMFEDGGYYKYYAPGSPSNSSAFQIYHSLTLTLYHKNNSVVVTASTNEWNTSFWDDFLVSDGFYNLTAVDQSGRNPIGATISITFAGVISSSVVTSDVNYVIWDKTHLASASFESHEAFLGDMIATGGAMPTPPTITLTINVFGPDNTLPDISSVILTPDPDLLIPHDPYFNITFTVTATDTGSGIQFVNMTVEYRNPDPGSPWVYVGVVQLTNIAPNTYEVDLNIPPAFAQYYIRVYPYAVDYAGHGVNAAGTKQTNPSFYYSTDVADCNWFIYDTPFVYQVGDVYGPVEESAPTIVGSSDPYNPSVDITVYMNDSIVYSGMTDVLLRVDRYNTITETMEYYFVSNVSMTQLAEDMWFYTLDMDYNYEYYIYYIGVDTAGPYQNESPLGFYGDYYVEAIDDTPPTVSPVTTFFNGSIATTDDIVTYNVTITDTQTSISSVILSIDITLGETVYVEDYEVEMTRVGLTDIYSVQVDLGTFGLSRAGTYALLYSVTATDGVGNSDTVSASMGVVVEGNALGIDNLGAIIGGVIGGVVVLLAGLFLWFNRHTIQTYAKKQTFKRRLKDYLREIIEDIKKDGLEGRYKEGLLKSWSVLEGIGREFFDLPRYRSQTPTEFGRLLAYRGKIESELINTLLFYFEKARYGYEEITEVDFNSGVRALLKIVDKIEVGEMKIES